MKALEAENDAAAVAELAKSNGFDFSVEELQAEIQKRQAEFEKRHSAGELTDEKLEAVACGATPALGVTAVMSVIATVATWKGGVQFGIIPPAKW